MGIRSNTVATAAPLPTIEAIIEGQGTPAPEAPQIGEAPKTEPAKEETSRLDQIEREQRHRRELFAAQKRIKELEAKSRDTSDKTSLLDAKNPIKEIAKAKGINQDDLIKMALDAMDDDLTDAEKKDDLSKMKPEEIAKLVREQIESEQKQKDDEALQQKTITDFKAKIAEQAKSLAETMPLVDALGGTDAAFNMINEKFLEDSDKFGDEYARENLMTIDEAIKKTNDILAENVKTALQSKHLRDFITKLIKEDGFQDKAPRQSEDEDQLEDEAVTLTNTKHRAATEATGKPSFASDEDELNHLINTLI